MKGYSRTKMLTIEHYFTHLTIICNNKRIPWSCNKSLANLIPILLEGRYVLQGTHIEFEYMVLTKRIGWYFSCKHYLPDLNCIATRVKPFANFGAKYIYPVPVVNAEASGYNQQTLIITTSILYDDFVKQQHLHTSEQKM